VTKALDWVRSATETADRTTRRIVSDYRYARELHRLRIALDRGDRPREGLALFDEIVVFARLADHGMLPMALSCQASYRCCLRDDDGAVDAADEAIRLLEPLAVEKPGRYGEFLLLARFALAFAYYRLDRLAEAVPALERYIRMVRLAPGDREPGLRKALTKLVNAQVRLDRPAKALPHVEEVVRISRSSAAANPFGRKADLYEADLAFALEGESTCRRLAGLDARDSAVESVAILCQLIMSDTNYHARGQHAGALAHALGTLDAALDTEHNAEAVEIGRWLEARKDNSFKEWVENAHKSFELVARLFELSMRSFVKAGRVRRSTSGRGSQNVPHGQHGHPERGRAGADTPGS
jgi:hypothetical protein